MTTSPVVTITDELAAELEAAADYAANQVIRSHGWEGTVDEFADGMLGADERYMRWAEPATILALLSERADLKRDAERYRLFAATVAAEFAGLPLTGSQKALFDAMNSREEVSGVDDVGAMFDAAMTP